MKETFRSEWVYCNKPSCRTCPHGPYWYAYHRAGGKLRKRYVGKVLPKKESEAEEKHPEWSLMFNDSTASLSLACEILGITPDTEYTEARTQHRRRVLETHPDRFGDCRESMQVNAAWSYVTKVLWR